jgi:hypothetical protein
MPAYYDSKDFHMVFCSLEIIGKIILKINFKGLIGPNSISFNNIKLLASILIDEAIPVL